MVTQIAYSEIFQKHNNIGHPENAQRTTVMMQALHSSVLADKVEVIEPVLFPEDLLFEIHDERMINQIKEISETQDSWVDLDTYVCKHDFETARLAVGSVVQLCKNVLNGDADNGFALVRPPGHHATPKTSMGFCLFNNAALAAKHIVKQGKKVLIFDLDVHHGNGTQNIFYTSNDVLYQSFHLSPHFPGTGKIEDVGMGDGAGYTVNAPLSYGNGNTAIDTLMKEIFLPIAEQFQPDFIIVSSGFDSHHADPLGGLRLTVDMYGKLIEQLLLLQPKLVCTLEGGYNFSWIGPCFVSQIGALCGSPQSYKDTVTEEKSFEPVVAELKRKMKQYWDI